MPQGELDPAVAPFPAVPPDSPSETVARWLLRHAGWTRREHIEQLCDFVIVAAGTFRRAGGPSGGKHRADDMCASWSPQAEVSVRGAWHTANASHEI
jgi:hypothetical protein